MANKLSYSSLTTYTTCGQKYFLRYKKNIKSKYAHGALLFGSAIDGALNKLLSSRDLKASKEEFDKLWSFQWVNKKYVSLSEFEDLVYAETDFDEELLQEEDWLKLEAHSVAKAEQKHPLDLYEEILAEKKKSGWVNISLEKKKFYNYCNWLSMTRKGYIMLESYNKKVLPKIKNVIVVQKENYLKNSDGDTVVQYLDMIIEWIDGRILLMDNKTSAKEYLDDSAGKSPQLISYYFGAKEEYKLDAVGFIVLMKTIIKNRVKVCSICGYDGSGARHKTCSNEVQGKRCNGSWKETISPECFIDVIINNVKPAAESLVLEAFNEANDGIKKENWYKNLGACRVGNIQCEYVKLCWSGDDSEVIDMSKVKND